MSEKEMNSYRLTSLEEPTDEMLTTLMKEVAEEAKRKSEEAHKKFFQEIREYIRKQRAKWGKEYNVSFSFEILVLVKNGTLRRVPFFISWRMNYMRK